MERFKRCKKNSKFSRCFARHQVNPCGWTTMVSRSMRNQLKIVSPHAFKLCCCDGSSIHLPSLFSGSTRLLQTLSNKAFPDGSEGETIWRVTLYYTGKAIGYSMRATEELMHEHVATLNQPFPHTNFSRLANWLGKHQSRTLKLSQRWRGFCHRLNLCVCVS